MLMLHFSPTHDKKASMKHSIRTALTFALLSLGTAAVHADPVDYTLDNGHTQVLFSWNHFGFSNPTANFNTISGTLKWDEKKPTDSSVSVTIPLDGLDTHVAKLDEHLKSPDFFDAAKYPNITFNSTKVVKGAKKNTYKVTGDLTVHGVTKPITLDVVINKVGIHPMIKKPDVGINATGTLKRSDFGVAAYVPNVSDEIKLNITAEALGAAEAPAAQ